MSDLLERLKLGAQAIAPVRLGDIGLGLRLLTEQDYMAAGMAANAAMKAAGVELSVATADLFEDEKSSQLLALALIDPETRQPVAKSALSLREAITRAQRAELIEHYLEHEKAHSPSGRTLSNEEFSDLLEAVKKTPEMILTSDSSGETLKRLIISLASQPSS